jgi:sugar lactone lactonase YvrE
MTNIAFGGPDYKTMYITEALSGDVLAATMPVAGKKLFGLM